MGWWSDVLADGVGRADGIEIVSCFTRSEEKRQAFAQKYNCAAASSYEEILADPTIQGIINTTPNNVHLETTRQAADAGKHIFLDKPIANSVGEGMEVTKICRDAGVKLSIGFQRRRESQFRWVHEKVKSGDFGILVQAEANISRDRLGAFDEGHWRYCRGNARWRCANWTSLCGCSRDDNWTDCQVSGMLSQLVLPGDNPDVAGLVMRHENGAVSTLNAGYASAGENYVMNIYGKRLPLSTRSPRACIIWNKVTPCPNMYRLRKTTPSPSRWKSLATVSAPMENRKSAVNGHPGLWPLSSGVKSANERRVVTIKKLWKLESSRIMLSSLRATRANRGVSGTILENETKIHSKDGNTWFAKSIRLRTCYIGACR